MKTMTQIKLLVLILLLAVAPFRSSSQTGFEAGSYYLKQYSISDVAVGYPYVKYDYYGRPAGTYQLWQRASWHRESGGSYVMVWSGYSWQSQWVSGYYYWYDWVNYERFIGY